MPIDDTHDRQIAATDSAFGTNGAVSVVEEFLSVLASNWVTAMEPHLRALTSLAAPAPAESHQVSHVENAHAVAVATMLVFALESNAARLAAVDRLPANIGRHANALRAIESVLADRGEDPGTVTELFVLRDVIVHDHVWAIRLKRGPDRTDPPSLIAAELRRGRISDKKYSGVAADEGTNRSRRLRLHLVPTEVRRWDVATLLPVACAVFDALAERDLANMPSLADQSVRISDRLLRLRDFIPLLQGREE